MKIYDFCMQVNTSDCLSLRRYQIVGGQRVTRSVTQKCLTCRRYTARPNPQMLGQLPVERITPGSVFDRVGVDYAGPVCIKYGFVRKPILVKAYICVFVSLTVKAVHLKLVTSKTWFVVDKPIFDNSEYNADVGVCM